MARMGRWGRGKPAYPTLNSGTLCNSKNNFSTKKAKKRLAITNDLCYYVTSSGNTES